MLKPIMNKGINYIDSIIKFMGIKHHEELLVDGTGYTKSEMKEAIEEASKKIDDVIDDMKY